MRVFVGGTYKDIEDFRHVAYESLRKHAPVETMEDFPTSEKTVKELCLERVELSTHYLLIIGRRYGWIPNGETRSITEIEYDHAVKLGRPRKVYIFEPNGAHPVQALDDQVKLDAFKERVRNDLSPRPFTDDQVLKHILEVTMRDWFGSDSAVVESSSQATYTGSRVTQNQEMQGATAIAVAPVQQLLDQARSAVIRFIEEFHDEAYPDLEKAVDEVIAMLKSEQTDILKAFMHQYRFPFTSEHDEEEGIAALIEVLVLLKTSFADSKLLHQDAAANVNLDDEEDVSTLLAYAVPRNTKMPQVLLEVARRMAGTSAGKQYLKRGFPLLPNPVVIDNCSKGKKMSLCASCGDRFSFKDILKNYTRTEEDSYFRKLEDNNFKELDDTKVLCGECLRKLRDEVSDLEELRQHVRGRLAR